MRILLFFILLSSCSKDRFYSVRDPTLKEIMQNAITRAGGFDSYDTLDSLNFIKRTKLFASADSLESDLVQNVWIYFHPDIRGNITWQEEGTEHKITYEGGVGKESVHGLFQDNNDEAAKRAFLSSYFVMFIPFKLLDEGVRLSYEGIDTINGRTSHIVRADFNPEEHSNHSTNDTWWVYFDSSSFELVGYLVYHAPTYALVLSGLKSGLAPMNFDSDRQTFRVDSLGSIQFLRANFEYKNIRAFY